MLSTSLSVFSFLFFDLFLTSIRPGGGISGGKIYVGLLFISYGVFPAFGRRIFGGFLRLILCLGLSRGSRCKDTRLSRCRSENDTSVRGLNYNGLNFLKPLGGPDCGGGGSDVVFYSPFSAVRVDFGEV
jgi:hypothetical protein